MPYFVEVAGSNVRFPEVCSVCCGPGPFVAMERSFTQGTGYYVVAYSTSTTTMAFPTCGQCVVKAWRMLILAWALMVLPWALVCFSPSFSDNKETVETIMEVSAIAAAGSVLAGIGLLFYRGRFLRNLRMVYTSQDRVVFASHRREFAEAFAAMNGSKVEEKAMYLRVS